MNKENSMLFALEEKTKRSPKNIKTERGEGNLETGIILSLLGIIAFLGYDNYRLRNEPVILMGNSSNRVVLDIDGQEGVMSQDDDFQLSLPPGTCTDIPVTGLYLGQDAISADVTTRVNVCIGE